MKKYVLGFAFNADNDFVILIKKNKPEWQKGSFNGVGGKIEKGENPPQAMSREFMEETGVETKAGEWEYVAKMNGENWECWVYKMSDDNLMDAQTMTDEEISVFPVSEVLNGDYKTISNIPFLIELCRDQYRPKSVSLTYAE